MRENGKTDRRYEKDHAEAICRIFETAMIERCRRREEHMVQL